MDWVNAVVQGVLLGGQYALLACGLSLIFGVMRIVNLAHGMLAVAAAYAAFWVLEHVSSRRSSRCGRGAGLRAASATPCSGGCSTRRWRTASSRRCWSRSGSR